MRSQAGRVARAAYSGLSKTVPLAISIPIPLVAQTEQGHGVSSAFKSAANVNAIGVSGTNVQIQVRANTAARCGNWAVTAAE